jgi:hypothetical protein
LLVRHGESILGRLVVLAESNRWNDREEVEYIETEKNIRFRTGFESEQKSESPRHATNGGVGARAIFSLNGREFNSPIRPMRCMPFTAEHLAGAGWHLLLGLSVNWE